MKCMFPNCESPRYSRGLCTSHYSIARNLVKGGKTTWQKLEQDGKTIAPGKKNSTIQQQWFLQSKP